MLQQGRRENKNCLSSSSLIQSGLFQARFLWFWFWIIFQTFIKYFNFHDFFKYSSFYTKNFMNFKQQVCSYSFIPPWLLNPVLVREQFRTKFGETLAFMVLGCPCCVLRQTSLSFCSRLCGLSSAFLSPIFTRSENNQQRSLVIACCSNPTVISCQHQLCFSIYLLRSHYLHRTKLLRLQRDEQSYSS